MQKTPAPKRRFKSKNRPQFRRKVCRFCVNKRDITDYKDVDTLKHFVTDKGKILPRTVTGNCAKHQRQVTRSIKRARTMALVHYKG